MSSFRFLSLALLCLFAAPLQASTELAEVQRLVSTNLPTLNPDDLTATTVEDLLSRLGPRVRWVEATAETPLSGEAIVGTRRFPGDLGYVRLGEIKGDIAVKLDAALAELGREGQLRGLVLDLRFAGGRDFPASAQASALFFPSGEPVLDWGEGSFAAPGRTNRFAGPVAILVNSGTHGSAEALAAALRSTGHAIVIGGKTAGEAAQLRDFPLSTGRVLRLAVAPVKTGDGLPIASDGVAPDISVLTAAEAERRFLVDPFTSAVASPSGTAPAELSATTQVRRRLTEAELIRNKRQALGQPDLAPADPSAEAKKAEAAGKALVQDPALARGIDFLTGLNAVTP